MSASQHPLARVRAFLSRHKALRVALILAVLLILLILVLHPKGTKTFLVLGMDNYGSLDETGRSDVMMLAQIDFTNSTISTVTFARDMIIKSAKGNDVKINTIVRTSGEDALVQALEQDFDLQIDGWFRVNFTTVIELVDAIGGAEVELTSKEASYIDRTIGAYPDSPLSEGLCHLNGAQALCYARCRALDNDIGRGQRQNKLMAAMVQSTRHMTAAKLMNVFESLKHAWRSSLSAGEQVKLLLDALWLRGVQVNQIGVPFEGYWRYGSDGIVIQTEQNVRLLHEALGLPEPAL
ncbi:MAG: LCP family protein [Clostridia bacterium]|nr:LCP family protein [Clostridia bacterium]